MISTQDTVRELLESNPELRDDDLLLMLTIWKNDSNFFNFFQKFRDGKLPQPETIRRARQKLQEENPHLRGELYGSRQKRQIKVKKDLGYPV